MFHRIIDKENLTPKKMVILIAKDVDIGNVKQYTTDPYIGWINADGSWARWPHNFEPTHYSEIDYRGL